MIRREVQAELKDLNTLFIAYEPGKSAQALNAKRHEIYKHRDGGAVFEYLRTQATEDFNETKFIGLNEHIKKRLWPPFRQRNVIAIFFVNAAHFVEQDQLRHWAYSQVWKAIALLKNYRKAEEPIYEDKNGIVAPKPDATTLSSLNMLGDAFAAIIQNLKGQDGHISAISRQRCLETVRKLLHHNIALYPFPIAEEAAQIVYEDLYDKTLREQKPFTLAAEMAGEIGYTFDDTAINQWQNFANRAQEMAWMDFDKSKILSTAIYTSEDPYVRSMAYLVAETLNLHPAPSGELGTHNPFADQEVNERAHIKLGRQLFKEIISNKNPAEALLEKSTKQNQKLLEGHVMGWSAYAMLDALMVYKDLHDADTDLEELATAKFEQSFYETDWKALLKLNRIILRHKRDGTEMTPELVQNICTKHDGMELIALAMENARPEMLEQAPEVKAPPLKEKAADDNAPAAPLIQIDHSFD